MAVCAIGDNFVQLKPLMKIMMRNLSLLFASCLLLCACGPAGHDLSKSEALALLKENKVVPAYYFTDISTADESVARKPQMDTLEAAGLVSVNRHPTLNDIGKPLVFLTAAGRKDSVSSPASAEKTERRLRVADMRIKEVSDLKKSVEGNNEFIDVTFVVEYTNISLFHILEKGDFNKPSILIRRFGYSDGKWALIDE
jgi:hypothetical protein